MACPSFTAGQNYIQNIQWVGGTNGKLVLFPGPEIQKMKTVEFDQRIYVIGQDDVNKIYFAGGSDKKVTFFRSDDFSLVHIIEFSRTVKTGG